MDNLKALISYKWDIKNCQILYFTESLLNMNKHASGGLYTVIHWLYTVDRTAASGKTRGGVLCIFVNNSWCTISKEVSRFCSPKVGYLMIAVDHTIYLESYLYSL
jgi:hypothetical protein